MAAFEGKLGAVALPGHKPVELEASTVQYVGEHFQGGELGSCGPGVRVAIISVPEG